MSHAEVSEMCGQEYRRGTSGRGCSRFDSLGEYESISFRFTDKSEAEQCSTANKENCYLNRITLNLGPYSDEKYETNFEELSNQLGLNFKYSNSDLEAFESGQTTFLNTYFGGGQLSIQRSLWDGKDELFIDIVKADFGRTRSDETLKNSPQFTPFSGLYVGMSRSELSNVCGQEYGTFRGIGCSNYDNTGRYNSLTVGFTNLSNYYQCSDAIENCVVHHFRLNMGGYTEQKYSQIYNELLSKYSEPVGYSGEDLEFYNSGTTAFLNTYFADGHVELIRSKTAGDEIIEILFNNEQSAQINLDLIQSKGLSTQNQNDAAQPINRSITSVGYKDLMIGMTVEEAERVCGEDSNKGLFRTCINYNGNNEFMLFSLTFDSMTGDQVVTNPDGSKFCNHLLGRGCKWEGLLKKIDILVGLYDIYFDDLFNALSSKYEIDYAPSENTIYEFNIGQIRSVYYSFNDGQVILYVNRNNYDGNNYVQIVYNNEATGREFLIENYVAEISPSDF